MLRRTLFVGLLAVPMLACAAGKPTFQQVASWPVDDGLGAPAYGTAEVPGVATDAEHVYVLQDTFPAILIFNKAGLFQGSWGNTLTIRHSCRVAPDGTLWITGIDDSQVAHFTTDGQLLAVFGERRVDGSETDPHRFNGPADVAFAPDGTLYIADGHRNHRIVHMTQDGQYLGQWGSAGHKWGQFIIPHSVAVDRDGNVYVADRENGRVQVFSGDGRFLHGWHAGFRPFSLWITPGQTLYVSGVKTISVYTLGGKRLSSFPVPGAKMLHMMTVDEDGSLYAADLDNHLVRKFVPKLPGTRP